MSRRTEILLCTLGVAALCIGGSKRIVGLQVAGAAFYAGVALIALLRGRK